MANTSGVTTTVGSFLSSSLSSSTMAGPGGISSFKSPLATSTGFNLGNSTQSNTSLFQSLSSSPMSTTFGATTSAATTVVTTKPSISFGLSSSAAPATAATAATALTTSVPSLFNSNTSFASTPSTTVGTAVAPATVEGDGKPCTFAQLEDLINRWTTDLEEQEKLFINQSAQINSWDNLLVSNNDKIIELHRSVETAKMEQNQLSQELNFIQNQQKDLEECLVPLEQQIESSDLFAHTEKQDTYKMAENINSQLQQMGEDLKEIIDHLNEKTNSSDQNDPITMIGRILNCHTNSLEWIDKTTNDLQGQIDQISKSHNIYKDYTNIYPHA